jgi:rhodanese-related sulfurtransferase
MAVRRVSVSEAAAEADALLVDVREPNEVAQVRIPGATVIPLSALTTRFGELPNDRPLLVFCAAGQRSLVAADFLGRNGYGDVASVDGGIIDWEARGLPVERG